MLEKHNYERESYIMFYALATRGKLHFIVKRNLTSSNPVKDVLKTSSPTRVPEAPNDFAFQIEPSSRTSLASDVFQGLSPEPKVEWEDYQLKLQTCACKW